MFGDVSPIGKRFRMDATNAPWIEVVGVVGHVRQDGLDVDPRPQVYWPYQQRTQDRMAMVVKTPLPPASIAAAIAAAIHAVDPDQPLYDVRPMTAVIDRTLQGRWLNAAVVGAFAMTALLLASVGLYGIVSYVSAGRRREFGIRMAVGATASNVAMLVLRQGAARTVLGLALGLGVSAAVAQRRGEPAARRQPLGPGHLHRRAACTCARRPHRERDPGVARGAHRPHASAPHRLIRRASNYLYKNEEISTSTT